MIVLLTNLFAFLADEIAFTITIREEEYLPDIQRPEAELKQNCQTVFISSEKQMWFLLRSSKSGLNSPALYVMSTSLIVHRQSGYSTLTDSIKLSCRHGNSTLTDSIKFCCRHGNSTMTDSIKLCCRHDKTTLTDSIKLSKRHGDSTLTDSIKLCCRHGISLKRLVSVVTVNVILTCLLKPNSTQGTTMCKQYECAHCNGVI
ncbi:hypothetical protein DPMN_089485 [Dreissena polymorpha]|uniref:Uncharacterized protein n=1 Tax=Dreissena polymorpha TaxID=45954 RepID=A0A9D4QY49_DREPO|nr:hypothetical protein DPMN_089485 [Dreissena polymorpha]